MILDKNHGATDPLSDPFGRRICSSKAAPAYAIVLREESDRDITYLCNTTGRGLQLARGELLGAFRSHEIIPLVGTIVSGEALAAIDALVAQLPRARIASAHTTHRCVGYSAPLQNRPSLHSALPGVLSHESVASLQESTTGDPVHNAR